MDHPHAAIDQRNLRNPQNLSAQAPMIFFLHSLALSTSTSKDKCKINQRNPHWSTCTVPDAWVWDAAAATHQNHSNDHKTHKDTKISSQFPKQSSYFSYSYVSSLLSEASIVPPQYLPHVSFCKMQSAAPTSLTAYLNLRQFIRDQAMFRLLLPPLQP